MRSVNPILTENYLSDFFATDRNNSNKSSSWLTFVVDWIRVRVLLGRPVSVHPLLLFVFPENVKLCFREISDYYYYYLILYTFNFLIRNTIYIADIYVDFFSN